MNSIILSGYVKKFEIKEDTNKFRAYIIVGTRIKFFDKVKNRWCNKYTYILVVLFSTLAEQAIKFFKNNEVKNTYAIVRGYLNSYQGKHGISLNVVAEEVCLASTENFMEGKDELGEYAELTAGVKNEEQKNEDDIPF